MEEFQLSIDWANRSLPSVIIGILVGILIFVVGRWLVRLITRYTTRSLERVQMDILVIRFVRTMVRIGLMVAVVITALNAAGIHTVHLTALLAPAGVAVGLAFKDSLANLAAGLMILLFRPYRVDDLVEAAGTVGSVEEVSIFNTILHTVDNVRVFVPNSSVISGNIRNLSANARRRVDLVAGIGYDADIGAARDILMDIITSHLLVLSDRAPSVSVVELAESTVNLAVRPWTDTGD